MEEILNSASDQIFSGCGRMLCHEPIPEQNNAPSQPEGINGNLHGGADAVFDLESIDVGSLFLIRYRHDLNGIVEFTDLCDQGFPPGRSKVQNDDGESGFEETLHQRVPRNGKGAHALKLPERGLDHVNSGIVIETYQDFDHGSSPGDMVSSPCIHRVKRHSRLNG